MSPGILGKKIGMTQVFRPDGQVVPVTVVKAGPCVVTQRKTPANDGYDAIQLGLVEAKRKRQQAERRPSEEGRRRRRRSSCASSSCGRAIATSSRATAFWSTSSSRKTRWT